MVIITPVTNRHRQVTSLIVNNKSGRLMIRETIRIRTIEGRLQSGWARMIPVAKGINIRIKGYWFQPVTG